MSGKNWGRMRTTRGPASDDLENLGIVEKHCPKLVRCCIKCYLGISFMVHRTPTASPRARKSRPLRGGFTLLPHTSELHSGDPPFDLRCDHPRSIESSGSFISFVGWLLKLESAHQQSLNFAEISS
jgi:hypothetical protein